MVWKSIITSKCKSCIFQLPASTVYVALECVLRNAGRAGLHYCQSSSAKHAQLYDLTT